MREINWAHLVRGLRAKLRISQNQLANLLNTKRKNISRYECAYRIPGDLIKNKLLFLIKSNNFDLKYIKRLGKLNCSEETTSKIKIEKSKDLAEFVGIILGDGELHRDGCIRISFDPKKEPRYLKSRIFPLIKQIFDREPTYESIKRLHFWSKNTVMIFEKEFELKPGNKIKHKWKIPEWCFERKAYLSAVLRGLFDTDGYFGYSKSHIELMFGRFAEDAEPLVNSISNALNILNIEHKVSRGNGRRRVRITNIKNVLAFFRKCGSSNSKHVVRFLLWHIKRYPAKIDTEGLDILCLKLKQVGINIDEIEVPFILNNNL